MKAENSFTRLNHNERKVPPGLKKKVMNDVASAKLILDLSGVFVKNIPSVIYEFLKPKDRNNDK